MKTFLRARLPRPVYGALRAPFELRPSRVRMRRESRRIHRIGDAVRTRCGDRVARGPFAGMRYVERAGWDFAAQLLGAYEEELHPVLERLMAKGYDRVVNVGCAEGYYAIGLALRLPDADVVAVDVNPLAREACRRLAADNGVADRVAIADTCPPDVLDALIGRRTLLVVDCEGYEYDLLDPRAAPALHRADVVVELHNLQHPSIREAMEERFRETHALTLVETEQRDPAAYDELDVLPWDERLEALNERRMGPQQWAVLEAQAT